MLRYFQPARKKTLLNVKQMEILDSEGAGLGLGAGLDLGLGHGRLTASRTSWLVRRDGSGHELQLSVSWRNGAQRSRRTPHPPGAAPPGAAPLGAAPLGAGRQRGSGTALSLI